MRRFAPRLLVAALLAAALPVAACSDAPPPPPPPPAADAAPRPVRTGTVHALPPHAIRNDSVGPYVVGARFYDVLHQLPDGPRIERLRLGDSVDWSVARAEDGKILVGAGDASRVAYIVILAPEIASIPEYGLQVGSTGAELIKVLGAETPRDVVSDRRWFRFAIMPGVRFLTAAPVDTEPDDARVVAVLLTGDDPRGGDATSPRPAPPDAPIPPPAPQNPCRAGDPAQIDEVIAAAKLRTVAAQPRPDRAPLVRWGCVTSAQREAVVVAGSELAIVGGEPGKWRRLTVFQPGPVDLAGALDVDGDGRDEIVIGRVARTEDAVAAEVQVLRWEANHLAVALAQKPYVVTSSVAAGAGMTLPQVELSMDVSAQNGALRIEGLYWATDRGRLHELAPLSRVEVKLGRKGGPAAPTVDAGPPGSATGTPSPTSPPHGIDDEVGAGGPDPAPPVGGAARARSRPWIDAAPHGSETPPRKEAP